MQELYRYDAFISYRHLSPDKPIAQRLQKLLETYTLPKELRQNGEQKKLHLFRDETELPSSNNLGNDIQTALEQSRFLIVICSSKLEKSKWCMQEIEYFKKLHHNTNQNILTIWVGEEDERPAFPDLLRFEQQPTIDANGNETTALVEIEPLAANVSAASLRQALKKLKNEFLRIAAPLLDVKFDDLFQREQRRQLHRRMTVALSVAAVLALVAFASTAALLTISAQKRQIAEDALQLRINHANLLVKESKELASNGNLYDALDAALQAFPEDDEDGAF